MGNPMLTQLNRSGIMGNLSQIKQAWGLLRGAKNPQAMLNQMMQNNPQVQAMMQASGGDPKAAFYKLAKEKGVDPDEIINALK